MRICTWNINSVRIRIDHINRLLAEQKPDFLCLQEIKVENKLFPNNLGLNGEYKHVFVNGQKAYNGVAIISRIPFVEGQSKYWCNKNDARHAWVVFKNQNGVKFELHNFYVPAGGDIPNPKTNEKFAHKLQFFKEITEWFSNRRDELNRFILVGDLNVAPLENDVWSHKQLLKIVSHTPIEVEALECLSSSHNWVDAVRYFVPPKTKLYTWWSYRAKNWEHSNRGRRLDHVWVTPALANSLSSASVLKYIRGYEKPSDHVPVIVDLDL